MQRTTVSPFPPILVDKPTLKELREQYPGMTMQAIADAAGVPLRDVNNVQQLCLVSYDSALRVLASFSKLTGGAYDLSNVDVNIDPLTIPKPAQRTQIRPVQLVGRRS